MSAFGVFRALEDILSALEVFSALEDVSSALGRYQYCYGASPMHSLIMSSTQIMIPLMH